MGAQSPPLVRHNSTSADAFSGDPRKAAAASSIAGCLQACLLLPANTIQTQMQHGGLGFWPSLKSNFSNGTVGGLRNLYRALAPTVAMLGLRQGLKFGVGTSFKRSLPQEWPELLRDLVSGSTSALTATTLFFPLDTLKTRWQTGQPAPSFGQMYFGYLPAITYSAFGMGLWVCCRNFLERQIPDPGSHRGALRYWKHLLTGALAGVFVQLPTFPFDTVKKRMQASENPGTLMSEARLLLDAGGPGRFYRGFTLKCGFVALNGALFNAVYVAVRRLMRMHE